MSTASTIDEATADALLARLRGRRDALRDRTVALAEIETPSSDAAAQGPALDMLGRWLVDLGLTVERVPGVTSGGVLRARSPGAGPHQLLVGHLDTVWPLGTLADRPVHMDGALLRGPGVLDMKAGLAMLVEALGALRAEGLTPGVPVVVLVTTDEEIGSGESVALIQQAARGADRVFVLEPSAGEEGRLKVGRKGSGRFTVTCEGRAAHAGLEPELGRSAVVELAHQILALTALHDPARGTTVSVGHIEGGVAVNVVPPLARAVVDVRAPDAAAAAHVEAGLRALRPVGPDTWVTVEGRFHRPPMRPTPAALRRLALGLGQQLGLALETVTVGGVSDGNHTSQLAPTLDGLGAVGDGAHGVDEHVDLDRTVDRAALLALLLLASPLDHADAVSAPRSLRPKGR